MSRSDLETLELEEVSITQNLEEECDKSPLNNCKNDGILDKLCKYHFFILISNLLLLLGSGICLIYLSLNAKHLTNQVFWINQLFKYLLIVSIQYICAYFVKYRDFKVNYSRKIVHISYFIWPQILDKILLKYQNSIYTELWNIWIIFFLLSMMSMKVREKIKFLDTLFLAVDRPEDRPYTLIWFSSQIIATLIILLPFAYYFKNNDLDYLIFIPILINGLGDGLAEPIGVKFGRHQYKTRGCLTTTEYTRSYEGSACVFIVSQVVILCYYHYLTYSQYIFANLVIPISATIVEAYAPHTWDSPLIYLTVLSLLLITLKIPSSDFS